MHGNKKIKVWHIIDSAGMYGAEAMLLQLVEEQIREGKEPTIVSIGNKKSKTKDIEVQSINKKINLKIVRMKDGPNFYAAYKILREAKQCGVDIIHSHGYKGNILFGFMSQFLFRIPIITTLHGWVVDKTLSKMRLYILLDKLSLIGMSRIVLVTDAMTKKIPLFIKLFKEMAVIRNGINREIKNTDTEIPLIQNILETKYVVGSIGRLSKEKGYLDLIKAISILRTNNIDVGLVIIGDGEEKNSLMNEAKRLNMADTVYMPGYKNNINAYLHQFDMLVISSYTEGLPLTLLEAMREKIPIIATNVGGIPSVITNKKNGLLIPSGMPKSIANAIKYIMDNQVMAHEMTIKAYSDFVEKYTTQIMAGKYNKIYHDVLAC